MGKQGSIKINALQKPFRGAGCKQSQTDRNPSLSGSFASLLLLRGAKHGGMRDVRVLLSPNNQISFVLQIASIGSLYSAGHEASKWHQLAWQLTFWPRSLPLFMGWMAKEAVGEGRERRGAINLPRTNSVWGVNGGRGGGQAEGVGGPRFMGFKLCIL